MTILQKPETINLSGNLVDFILSSSSAVSFVLKQDTRVLFEGYYTPNDNQRIEIDIKDIIEADLKAGFSDSSEPYEQPELVKTYTAEIAGQTHPFTVIKAGVDRLATSAANFLKANWLTWQPQVKKVTYYLPESLTFYSVETSVVKVKAYFQQPDGSYSAETKQLLSIVAGKAYTVPVQYAVIARKFESRLPAFYDVWFETVDGVRLSYIQRYVSSAMMSEDESWIVFENSLGGFDTFRAYGQELFTAEHDHQLAEIGDVTDEYNVDTTRVFQKNTGYITSQERKWLLDFFPSRQKYIYSRNYMRRIVVTDDDTSYTGNELPSSYTFNYRFADSKPYLNLQRVEELPADLTISIPDLGSFTIPPRLVEFPSQSLTEGVLFPVQHPYSEKWSTTTISAILAYILHYIKDSGSGGTGGVGHNHSNYKLLEALEYIDEYLTVNGKKIKAGYADVAWKIDERNDVYLHKDRIDQTEYLLKLLGGVEVGEFIDSMIAGKGAGIFADGRAQVESLEVRSYLKVMELIYNRLSALEGDYVMTESGTIEQLEDLGENTYRLQIRKRWDNDFTALEKDDILRASINNLDKAGEYYVAFYRVLSKNNVENTLTVVMYSDDECPSGHNYPPAKGMTMHRWGNTSDKKRQNCWYISSTEGRIVYLTGVTSPKLTQDMYASFYGLPVNLDIFANKPINYDEPYLYVRGLLAQDIIHVDHQGRLVYEIVDRGAWSEEVANSEDPYLFETKRESTGLMETHDVWLNSCRYRCLKTGTRLRPKWNSPDWVEISGDPKMWMDFEQPNGTEFAHAIDCPIHVHIYKGTEEITDDVLDADIEWTRDTGNPDADIAWAAKHSSSKKYIHITDDDCPPDVWLVKFTCKAFVRDNKGNTEPVENYYFVE